MRPDTSQRYGTFGRVVNFCAAFLLVTFCYAATAAADDTLDVLVLGDSLSAGYGLEPGQSFPAKLEKKLIAGGLKVKVHNAGVSGDTASAGLSRLDWALAGVPGGKPDLAIVELGANDALRGIDPKVTIKALSGILERFRKDGVPVLLAGMKAPPNMGGDYLKQFDAIYPDLAKKYGVALYPFFLEGVAGIRKLNLPDGIHPTAEGIDVIVTRITPMVHSLLTKQ